MFCQTVAEQCVLAHRKRRLALRERRQHRICRVRPRSMTDKGLSPLPSLRRRTADTDGA